MDNRKIRVAITHGDTNGIGYELIFKAFEDPAIFDFCTPIIYGSPKIASYHCNALGIEGNLFSIINSADEAQDGKLNLLPCFDEDVKVELGMPSQDASRAAIKSIDRAITDYKDNLFDVLITGPVDKDNMHVDGFNFPCNERFIESCIGDGKKGLDILINDVMRVAFATGDIALKDVPAAIDRWRAQGRRVAIYSSGSVDAQKLIFGYSTAGDLRPKLDAYFDTQTGPKKEAQSYTQTANALKVAAADVVFCSDNVDELIAAAAAGMQTRLVVRPGNAPVEDTRFQRVTTFDAEAFGF